MKCCDKGCDKGYSRKIRHVRKSNWCILEQTRVNPTASAVNCHEDLVSACQRALPWLEIMIADKRHLEIAPNDCVLAVQALSAALAKAKGETDMSDFITAGYDAQIAKLREQAAKAKGETAIEHEK